MLDRAESWDEADLLQLITSKTEESVSLEFKESAALQNTDRCKIEISKDVSAFANSAGGIIVYGIKEEGHVPVSIDGGSDPQVISREWLEQVINSRVQRRIAGIKINPVALTTTALGRVAYVVVIPQSDLAPHQASDKRYYRRFNFMSVPMEEYEIRDAHFRVRGPRLSLKFKASLAKATDIASETQTEISRKRVSISATIANEAHTPAESFVANLYIDQRLRIVRAPRSLNRYDESESFEVNRVEYECVRFGITRSMMSGVPIFTGTNFTFFGRTIDVELEPSIDYLLAYDVLAPHMEMRIGGEHLRLEGETVTLAVIPDDSDETIH